jgi:KDO2-lipid IV(A) lauroyltransferase
MRFLNQETGVQFGGEKMAKEYQAAVVFANIHRLKRGHYEVVYETICEDAALTPHGFITQAHTKKLEAIINKEPAYWLWSHKRWKHPRPVGETLHETLETFQH